MITTLLMLFLAGLVTLYVEMRRSVRGYEDEFGFHEGVESSFCTLSMRAAQAVASGWTKKNRSSKSDSNTIIQATLEFF